MDVVIIVCFKLQQEKKLWRGFLGIFSEEYNPTGSAVAEILSFRQTDRQRSTLYYRLAAVPLAYRGPVFETCKM